VTRGVCAVALLTAAACALLSAQVTLGVETFDAVWTKIRDSHFDKSMNGVNWDAVRTELRPRAEAARTIGDVRASIREMLSRLGQSHFALIPSTADSTTPASGGDISGTIGIETRLIGRDLVVSRVDPRGSAAASGVRAGWRISEIGGVATSEILRALPEGAPERLIQVEAWRLAQTRLRGPNGSSAAVAFEDGGGRIVRLSIARQPEPGEPVTVGSLPTMFVRVESDRLRTPAGRTAGLIRFNVWMTAVDPQFQKALDEFRTADGIVIDLRGNPGGLAAMIMGISGHFIAERKPLGVMKTRDTELRFPANPRFINARGERVEPYAGPVAILVDGLTGSASECFAGGMQSVGRARVFGQTSMGQALPALFERLPNGDVLIYATADFVTADGTRLEGRGVIPDESVPLGREDLLAGRDAALGAALAWLDRAPAPRNLQHP
jgi:carboxyl-terminal processing protease